jgi:hypothetical protein
LKQCSKCGQLKPRDQFYAAKGGRDGLRGDCKACFAARHQAWYAQNKQREIDRVQAWRDANPEKYAGYQAKYRSRPDRKLADRAGHLKRKFGLTLEQYDQLLASQGGGCAICGAPPEPNTSLHIDHDHDTGAVRGLLCVRCNNALGQLREDSDLVRAAASYLDGHDETVAQEVELARARARRLIPAGH